MSAIPILLALAGIALLLLEIRCFIFVRRSLAIDDLPKPWRRRRFITFVFGLVFVVGVSTLWQGYPLNGGTAAGVPFMIAWYDAKGRDYVAWISLLPMLGDLAFWFLVPYIVLAFFVRKLFANNSAIDNLPSPR